MKRTLALLTIVACTTPAPPDPTPTLRPIAERAQRWVAGNAVEGNNSLVFQIEERIVTCPEAGQLSWTGDTDVFSPVRRGNRASESDKRTG